MQSCAWMNGQYHQVGPPPSQSSQAAAQFTHITMRNHQAGSAVQYRTANTGVRPPQSADFTYDKGANPNRRQQLSSNTQSGNHSLPFTSVFQQDFHQSPAQNSLTQSPPNTMKVNTTHPQQSMSAHWKQMVRVHGKQSVRAQEDNAVSDLQRYGNPNSLFHNVNGESAKSFPAYTTTVISPPQQDVIYNGILVPASAHNRQTAVKHSHKQNGTQHGFSPSIDPPGYSMAISQSVRNRIISTTSSSWGQVVQVSSMSQKSQQYSTHNNGGEAISSTDSNLCSRQYEIAMIARIADDLRKSFPAASDGPSPVYSRSPSGGKQFGSEVRVTASNQNMQPVTSTVTQSCNSTASQSPSLNSGHFLPQMIHGVTSTQHSVVVPQQQNSVPNVFHVMPTGDGKGNGSKAANSFIRKNVGSLSAASYLKKLSASISSQQNETQSSVASNRERRERLEMRSSVKTNDTSSHSSPGRTRAVAVVQPLSYETSQVACEQTCPKTVSQLSAGTAMDESLSNPEKFFISPKDRSYSYTNQMASNKSAIRHSAASNAGTSVSSSDSAGPQDLLQKQSCVDDTGPELANSMQVDQAIASSTQQLVTSEAQATQSGDKDNNEMPTDPKGFFELSSVPTTPWTLLTLSKLIQDAEKSQTERKDFTEFDCSHKLLDVFWKGSSKNLLCEFKVGWMNEMGDVRKFCREHVKSDSVILSQVKHNFRKQLKSFHVLRDNEVYSELPYKSTWLNANDQLDDIDKEFGFPWSLKHQLRMPESDSHPEQLQIDNGISAQIVSEMSNKIELEPVGSREEEQESTVSTQTASSKRMESADSSDPYCNIEIQVLPPEEAMAIFEQVQSQLSQSTDMDNQPERVRSSSVLDESPKVMDATSSGTKLEKEPVCPIKEICCIERYIELIWGPNTASSSKCRCKSEQSHEDITDKALDKEEMAVQKKNIVISSAKGESQAKAGENVGSQVMTLYWPELRNEQDHTTHLTEDAHKPHPYSDKEQKNISQIKINSQSSIILTDESEDDLSSSENEVSNKMKDFENDSEQAQVKLTKSNQSSGSNKKETKEFFRNDTEIQSDLGVDCVKDQLKSTGSMQSSTKNSSNQDIEDLWSSESEVASQMSDLEENYGRAQLTATNMAESLETGEQTDMSATGTLQTTWSSKHATFERKKTPRSHDHFFPIFNKSKKCKSLADLDSQPVFEGSSKCGKAFVGEVDNELSASNVKTAELVLFGSTPQDRCVSVGCRKSNCSFPVPESDAVPRPPKVITVKFSPSRRRQAGEYSVKQQLYEKFRSFSPSKTRHRSKLKKQKCAFSSSSVGSLRKAEMVRSVNTEELPVSYKMRKCLSLKWRRFRSNKLKREKEKRKYSVTLNQFADQERSKAENGSHAATPLQNNIVLKFTVLPNTFNFKDGSSGKEEFSDPVPDKPDLVEEMDRSHNTAVTKATGKWLPNPEKKHSPLVKTYSIFNEYQKKFMERRQTSTD